MRDRENGRAVGVVEEEDGFGRAGVGPEGFGEVSGVELDCAERRRLGDVVSDTD